MARMGVDEFVADHGLRGTLPWFDGRGISSKHDAGRMKLKVLTQMSQFQVQARLPHLPKQCSHSHHSPSSSSINDNQELNSNTPRRWLLQLLLLIKLKLKR